MADWKEEEEAKREEVITLTEGDTPQDFFFTLQSRCATVILSPPSQETVLPCRGNNLAQCLFLLLLLLL